MNAAKQIICQIKARYADCILIVIWLAIAVFAMLNHELWRDESRVWQFVNCLDFKNVIASAASDGHPFLWYIILFPLAKLHLPVYAMQLTACLAVFSAVCIFCFKSKFNFFIKALFVFSAGMIYFMPVMCRNYALIPPVLLWLALLYPKRTQKPYLYTFCIVLLSQTHSLMWGACAVIWILYALECIIQSIKLNRQQKISLYAPLILFIIYSVLMINIFNSNIHNSEFYSLYENLKKSAAFDSLLSGASGIYHFVFKGFYLLKFLYIAASAALIFYILKTDLKLFLIFIFSVSYMFFIFIQIWFGGIYYQKFFLITLMLIFCCMIAAEKTKSIFFQSAVLFYLALNMLIFSPFEFIADSVNHHFTNTKQISEFLLKNNIQPEEYIIIDSLYISNETFSAYLGEYKKLNRIILYDAENFNSDAYESRITEEINKRPQIKYLIINECFGGFIKNTKLPALITVNKSEKMKIYSFSSDEFYYLYRIQ